MRDRQHARSDCGGGTPAGSSGAVREIPRIARRTVPLRLASQRKSQRVVLFVFRESAHAGASLHSHTLAKCGGKGKTAMLCQARQPSNFASIVILAFSSFDTGQPAFALPAIS